MISDKLHRMDFGGHSVWVTISHPAIVNPETNEHTDAGVVCAFKIGDEPRMTDGEYIKENGKIKFFEDHNTALCAALEAARKRIRESSL